jgi:hypothetical protein
LLAVQVAHFFKDVFIFIVIFHISCLFLSFQLSLLAIFLAFDADSNAVDISYVALSIPPASGQLI